MNVGLQILGVWMILMTLWCGLMLIRNDWVHRERLRLINEFHERRKEMIARRDPSFRWDENWDDEYLSYDGMLYRFWIWDVERLRK